MRGAPSVDNPAGALPRPRVAMPEGTLTLPAMYTRVRTLEQVVPVDYKQPGCPPNHDQVWKAMSAVIENKLPPKGSLIGVDPRAVCDQCPRTREGKIRVERFYRVHELVPEPERCLLEQGLICAGPATHAGCGALCVKVNMPCRGCYGPPEGVVDQGATLLSAVVAGMAGQSDAEIRRVLATVADPVGTFYRFSLAASLLQQVNTNGDGDTICASQRDGTGEAAE
jgi:F420-non-reducing hydrogenase small subunit